MCLLFTRKRLGNPLESGSILTSNLLIGNQTQELVTRRMAGGLEQSTSRKGIEEG